MLVFNSIVHNFYALLIELSWPLLIGFFIGALISKNDKFIYTITKPDDGPVLSTFKAIIIDFVIPICSCGIIPLYQSLVRKKISPYFSFAILLATPQLNFIAIYLSFSLLGADFTILRILFCSIITILLSLIIARGLSHKELPKPPCCHNEHLNNESLFRRFFDLFIESRNWIFFGILISALVGHLNLSSLLSNQDIISIILACFIGIPLYVCASGATTLVMGLLIAGVNPLACIVFLFTGPLSNLSTFSMLKHYYGLKKSTFIFLSISLSSILAAIILLYLGLGNMPAPVLGSQNTHHSLDILNLIGLILLGFVSFASFFIKKIKD